MNLLQNIYYKVIIFFLLIALSPFNLKAREILILKDLEIESFINDLLKPIFKTAGITNNAIKIYIVNDQNPGAFVTEGQNIFIHLGLLSFADSADEVAGVLAHELGHITAGHLIRGTQAYQDASLLMFAGLASFLAASLIASAGNSSSTADLSSLIGFVALGSNNLGVNSYLNYSTAAETQADQLAVEYIKKTPYSLEGMKNFMEKLYKMEDKSKYELPNYTWFSTHPLTLNRVEFFQAQLKKSQKDEVTKTDQLKGEEINKKFQRVKIKVIASSLGVGTINNLYPSNSTNDLYAKALTNYLNYDYSLALAYVKKLRNQEPNNIYFKELEADILFDSKNYKGALNLYKDILISSYSISYLKIARAYFALNQFEETLKNINIALQINPNIPVAWHLKSLVYGKLNRFPEANLALSEKFMLLQDYNQATIFANKAIVGLPKNSDQWLKAQDIIDYNIKKSSN